MASIKDLFPRLSTEIKSFLALPKHASLDDYTLPAQEKAKFAVSTSKAPVEDIPIQSGKRISDHVYEVASPSQGKPSIELIFFHGLQLKRSEESHTTHLDTWRSQDGKELWLKWILDEEKFPDAHILTISYDAHAEKTEKDGNMNMYVTVENLLQDLTQAGVGQNKCPLVLIGHCIGGLVLKELCVSATEKLSISRETRTYPIQKFLGNVRGLFFYATPHSGTKLAETKDFTKGCLFESLEPLNSVVARQREKFCTLRQKRDWKTYGMVETFPVTLGKFKGLVVPEASARCDMDEFYTMQANHFNICKPTDRKSATFQKLINFIQDVVKEERCSFSSETAGQVYDEEAVHEWVGLPQHPVGLERRAQEMQDKLKGGAILGVFGMGGIGKTALAGEVFNRISKEFEYTCFAENVKGFHTNKLRESIRKQFFHKGNKLDNVQWSHLKGKKTLLVMDDIDSVGQLRVLPPWHDFGAGSCLIMTGRERGVFRFYKNCIIHDVEFLGTNESTELFCNHAFDSEDILHDKSEHLRQNVEAVVKRCGGLPLTLEVMGRYLCNAESDAVWDETVDNLGKAIPIDSGQIENDEVWATLELSYNKLSKEAQDMFCDAGTRYSELPLDVILRAWSNRNGETTWKNLVDRAMVKVSIPFREVKYVWVHEQLRDLAKRLTNDIVLLAVDEEAKALVDRLNARRVNAKTKTLRLEYYVGRDPPLTPRPTLRVESLVWLEHLEHLEIRGVLLEGDPAFLTDKLRVLMWDFCTDICRLFPISLINMKDLAVLELRRCKFPKDFPATLGTLGKLRDLNIVNCDVPEGFHKAVGNLTHLHRLRLIRLNEQMQSLSIFGNPCQSLSLTLLELFGKLTALNVLNIESEALETLPDSFGTLRSLRTMYLVSHKLERLPGSFADLLSLERILFDCKQLKHLRDGFGKLATLKKLFIQSDELKTLPDSFGRLSSLRTLVMHCPQLKGLSDDFGHLTNLKELVIVSNELDVLPDNFGRLSSLEGLQISSPKLKALSDDFSHLTTLKYLAILSFELDILSDNFGRLSSLERLWVHCRQLKRLPDDFGHLTTLQHLAIESYELDMLPDNFGELSSLETFTIRCPRLKGLNELSHRITLKEFRILFDEEDMPRDLFHLHFERILSPVDMYPLLD